VTENKVVVTRNKYSWNIRMTCDEVEMAITLPKYPTPEQLSEMETEFEWLKKEVMPLA